MSNTQTNYFAQLAAVDVSDHVEKKGQFSYLSWPYAVAQLRQFDETATWEVKRFDGLPYLATENGTFVEVAVTVKGVTLSQLHPVLDARNKPLLAPTSFDINTSIQRALVKAIALHGLGLYIYAGEDLPHADTTEGERTPPQPSTQGTVRAISSAVGPELLTPNQLRYIKRLINETGSDAKQLLSFFGYGDLSHIPKVEVNRVIRQLESNRKDAA